jgi:hypothetical protein
MLDSGVGGLDQARRSGHAVVFGRRRRRATEYGSWPGEGDT